MPDEGSERIGVLVIRAWLSPEQHELIARITGRIDLETPEETSQTAAGVDAATRIAGQWLRAFERAGQQNESQL